MVVEKRKVDKKKSNTIWRYILASFPVLGMSMVVYQQVHSRLGYKIH
jgi:hypothetical protein